MRPTSWVDYVSLKKAIGIELPLGFYGRPSFPGGATSSPMEASATAPCTIYAAPLRWPMTTSPRFCAPLLPLPVAAPYPHWHCPCPIHAGAASPQRRCRRTLFAALLMWRCPRRLTADRALPSSVASTSVPRVYFGAASHVAITSHPPPPPMFRL